MTRTLLATALLAALMATTAIHAQSLADVAKKTEEERANAKQEQTKSDNTKKAPPAQSLADVAPTVLTILGLPVPHSMTGHSLAIFA